MARSSITGGCACGAIRYAISKAPLNMFNCHCHDCQRLSGSAYAAVMIVLAKAFTLTKGAPKFYDTQSMTNRPHKRGFCADCGTRLTGAQFEASSRLIGLSASSLDDSSIFKPRYDVFVSQAAPWDVMDPALPKYDEYPPAG